MKCLYKVPFSGFFIVSAESAEDAKSMSKDDPEVIYSEESNGDVETCPDVDSTLPIQIAPKGMRARKIASFFYAEGCKRVLESIDAASTIDPESPQPTSYRQGEYDGYANGNPVYDVLPELRRTNGGSRP
jgi:hypothetical protein